VRASPCHLKRGPYKMTAAALAAAAAEHGVNEWRRGIYLTQPNITQVCCAAAGRTGVHASPCHQKRGPCK
jgi:hypothetical protein